MQDYKQLENTKKRKLIGDNRPNTWFLKSVSVGGTIKAQIDSGGITPIEFVNDLDHLNDDIYYP